MIPPLADAHLFADALSGFGRGAVDLVLLVDDCPSLKVWRPTVAAFQEAAARCGAFRRVDRQAFGLNGYPAAPGKQPGGQVVLVFSDGQGEVWRHIEPFAMLRSWSRAAPLALITPLPQRRWYLTSLPLREVQFQSPAPWTATAAMAVRALAADPFEPPPGEDEIAVPVLELDPAWLKWWASLVRGRDQGWLDAMALIAGGPRDPEPPVDVEPHESVIRFRAEASRTAFQLAIYAAAAPADLEALRVVQARLLPGSTPSHLAEVVTSSLLVAPGAVPDGDFTFRTGIREALLACGTRTESAQTVETLVDYYGERMPSVQALSQALKAPDEVPDTPVTPQNLAFARVELAVLRALSGPYALRAKRLSHAIAMMHQPGPTGTTTESVGTMTTPASSTPPQQPSVLQALTGPAVSGESVISIDTLFRERETVWGNVPPRNGDFTGRTELLYELELRLRTGPVTAVLPQALHGMGGVGKSQIATEYAYMHRAEYDVIWWIPAEQPAQILRALIDLGESLDLNVGHEADTAVPAVLEALRAGTPYPNWLLIFDNAETIDTVRPYFPESGTGKVLVTSRNPEWTDIAHALEIDVFTREESVELLRKGDLDITVEEANQMAEALGDLPLAVAQAAAWRATTRMPVAEYLELLEAKRNELVGQTVPAGYEMPVAAAWNVALDRLGMENPAALQLLQVCSFFAPEPIVRELFTGPRNAPIAPELDETLQNPSRLSRAIRDIQRYGLARIDHRDQTIQIHRLVKTVLVSRLAEPQRTEMEHGAHVLLAGGNPGNPDNPAQWRRFHALVPHVVASNAVSCTDPWARQLVLDVIEFYYYWGNHIGCRDLARNVVETWRGRLEADDSQTLKAAKWLGFVLRILGAFSEAAEINRDCLARFQSASEPDEEGTLDAMSLVAADLRAAGDFEQARDLDQQALEACRLAFGEDDPITLTAAHSLGISLRLTGEYQRALQLDVDTCRRRAKVLGPDHGLTLLTLNGFLLDMRESGAYRQAHTEQEKLYERFQRVWRQDHQITLIAARTLSVSRRRAGYHEEARKLAEDTMNRLRQRFGRLHPDAIAATLNFAVDTRESDDLVASRALADQAFHDYETIFGPDHPYSLYARTNLGIVLRLLGEVDASHAHNSAAYELLRQRLGPDHVLTLTCGINLASDNAALGQHQKAYELDADILNRSRTALGVDHPSTLACALNLTFDLMALGRTEEGQRLYDEVLEAYRRVLGERHPAITAALARVRANCDVDPMPL